MKHIVAGQDQAVATWVAAGVPMMELGQSQYSAIGLVNAQGYMLAGVVFNTYTGPDVILSIRLLDRQSITRRFIVTCFRYVFEQLKCARCSVLVARRNKASQRFVKKLGWKYEGTLRQWYPDGQDAIVFGMLKSECRWLAINRLRRSTDGTVNGRTAAPLPEPGTATVDGRAGTSPGRGIPWASTGPGRLIEGPPGDAGPADERAADARSDGLRTGTGRITNRAAASLARAAARGRTQ